MKRNLLTTILLIFLSFSGLLGQSVDVITPNGGEVLTAGSTYTIQWVSYGSSFLVDLYYSTDGGSTWEFINDNLPVTGTYNWTVPNVNSTTCLVKAQSIYVDQSDAYFTIGAVANTLTILTPNGGESLTGGNTYNITWSSTGSFDYVEIWYSIDWGNNYNYIDDHAFNDGLFEWTVPNITTSSAVIKINQFGNTSVVDYSNNVFSINAVTNSVTLTSPNGGEVLSPGSSHYITWTTTGTVGNLELYLSTDSGSTWGYIDDNVFNDGIYEWTVPSSATTSALIKINEAGNPTIADQSDSTFEISAMASNAITVQTPNGGETLTGGSNYTITWSWTGTFIYAEIYYSTNGGTSWSYVDDFTANDGIYLWNVANIATTNGLIKVQEAGNSSVFDVSDAPFTISAITNSITITSPNGGEVLTSGTTHNIIWTSIGVGSYVEIWFSEDGGSNWDYINDFADNTGQYTWTVSYLTTTIGLIKINEVGNSSVFDISDSTFTIQAAQPSSITIIQPNGGESWTAGNTHNITWSSTGMISFVEIWYSTNNGNNWYYIDDYAQNSGQFAWTVPAPISTTNALIKINEVYNTSVVDVSDATFTISPPVNSITVSSPNGGETWTSGTTELITWTSTGSISNVVLYYSVNNGSSWLIINDYYQNTGQYVWTVPSYTTSNALIKIHAVGSSLTVDVSDSVFSIAASVPNSITVIYPNGGELLTGGSSVDVEWSTTGTIDYVEVWYSTDWGNNWNYIDDHAFNDGLVSWNVPNVSTTTALIKINEFGNTSVVDYSDYEFSITQVANSVTVISPNGGEVWTAGTTQIITWSTTGTFTYGAVEIWYSTNNGSSWDYIDDYATNNGQYAWTVPNVPTTSALIKINEVYNSSVVDVSDSTFEIAAVVSNPVTVTAPNGGETLTGGSTYDITWTSDGSITLLDIYYSTDGGTNWTFISDFETNDGIYSWMVPNISTSSAKIMITEMSNTSVFDVSDAVFTINAVANSVTVISPNGGEVWTAGTTQIITWSTTGTFTYGAVEIWYSTNNGSSWDYIDDYATNNGQYAWTVPNIPSISALIKINEVYNSSVVDVSDSTFEIGAASTNSITVITPNGGESLTGLSNYNITWTSSGTIPYVEIWYSTNGGSTWNYIDDHADNDGSFTWTVANYNTSNALIKINEFGNTSVNDISDAVFSISFVPPSLTITSPNGGEVWTQGSTQNITWSSIGSFNAVELWFSSNNGVSWSYIDNFAANTGQYTWTVPNTPTTTALVKINGYNTSVIDVSNAVFEISAPVSNTITVISPNGGETWTAGTMQDITWSTTGSIDFVEIWYSIDGGQIWNYIDDYSTNDGLYEWTVPTVSTLNALVKINEVYNTSVVDVSDSTFEISTIVSNPVTVVTPNGGETLTGGSTYEITWTSDQSITWLDLYYSTDGGQTWLFIADHEANDSSYMWTVPNVSTTNALIKITEFSNGNIYDESDAAFTINAVANSITVLSPNGGETWVVGSTHDITWSTTGSISYVEIWYSTNAGTSWTYIDDYSYNDGLYEWTIPNNITTSALVKINEVFNTSVDDVSDNNFEIAASSPFTVITPNGGEVLTGGSSYTITWSTSGYSGNYVGILYSTDGGTTWATVDDFKFNNGFKEWTVANVSTTNALIKVHEVFNQANGDVSDAPFTINAVPNSITVTSPNGGEVFAGNSTHFITWTTSGLINFVEIWYSTDGGNIWDYIDDYSLNDGEYEWNVPNVSTTNALIKINEVYNTSVVDVSDSTFTINEVIPIQVTTPNGGETLIGGSTYNITWISDGSFNYVDLYYSTDGGSNWNIIADHELNDSSYTWNVPNVSTTNALIAISEFNSSSTYDFSDAPFTITMVANSLTVITPNGGETWTAGSTQIITWSSTGTISNVEIWYSTDGGQVWSYIDDYAQNNGQYAWTVPNVTTVNALIKINEVYNTSVVDLSDAAFEINQIVSNPVTVTAPNGGEVLTGGSTYEITWTSDQSISYLDLYYSTDGGTTWNFIADHENNDSTYMWTVPNISTTNALIKITEFSNGNIFDVSDAAFTINGVPNTITVISPNGGEVWTAGSTQNITWSTTGTVSYVVIYYSTNNGTNWNLIDDYSYNDGLYEWTIPNLTTTNALIKIHDVASSQVVDISNGVFEIASLNTITVTTPNGGEILTAGSSYFITWTNTGVIDYVEIWFSSDAGITWSYIDDHAFNAGIFEWTVPNTITTNALIKINEFGNTSVVDVSDALFEIGAAVNSLTLTHPNGGQYLTISATYYVTWASTGNINNVDLTYSVDSGTTWSSIASNVPNNGQYQWQIPNTPSQTALVKVAETANPAVADASDSTFTITTTFYSSLLVLTPNGGETLTGGSTYEITWGSVGLTSFIHLLYSTDGGINWTTIDTYQGNNGGYYWTVPMINSQDVLVRVENQLDPTIGDNSDNVFTITSPVVNSITITSPNGGEVWAPSSVHDITWTSTGSISSVIIWYSLNGGGNWVTIANYAPNTGVYSWNLPPVTSTNVLVKVHDSVNPVWGDVSDNEFTIGSAPGSITVLTPNGGEVWPAGSTQNITWASTGSINHVEIWYSIDYGVNWAYINDFTLNDGLYEWTIPPDYTTNALVKINDESNSSVVDVSDSAFEIGAPLTSITLITPNGGEVLAGGTNYDITWSSTGAMTHVDIFYSLDGGTNWSFVANDTDNDGTYTWLVANLPTTNAFIAIVDSYNPNVSDASDSAFTISAIAQTITVTSPNGGEVWSISSTQNITWSTTGQVSYVKIWYSTDNGSNWTNIAPYNPNTGSYAWTVPNAPSTNALIKIEDVNNASIVDVSDTTFEIGNPLPNSITVVTPNGGEILTGASFYDITWASTGVIDYVEIWYSIDGGTNWTYIDDYSANDGYYYWNVVNVNTSNALIKINDVLNSSLADVSDSAFTINAGVNSITIISPNGGEVWTTGTTQNITWSSTGTIGLLEIYYSNDSVTWDLLDNFVYNSGSYAWTIPSWAVSSSGLIKIIDSYNVVDVSDSTFEIVLPPPGSITVITPNGGEVLSPGSNYNITWSSTGPISLVHIFYSINGGSNWIPIANDTDNDGTYTWQVPTTLTTNALMGIMNSNNSNEYDISDNAFEIGAATNTITILYPNGGEVLTSGDASYISWSSTGNVGNVMLHYSVDNGVSWILINDYVQNSGSYQYVLPSANSTQCLVRVQEAMTGMGDVSDSTFTIEPPAPASITIIYPNGGEVITSGDWSYVSWTSTGTVGNVMIHYSIDNGSNWILLNDNVQNSGGFQYQVPPVSSTQCLIKVQELGGSTVMDVSDSTFIIEPPSPASITINYPNGGEVITAGDWSYISWTSTGTVGNVMIHYSIDNGSNWILLNDNVQNSGGFQYQVPVVSSAQCLIKVQELGGSTVMDVSDSTFTIEQPAPASITINYPNGGEVITANDWSYISWTSTGISGNVMIHYSVDNGANWIMLNDNVQNSGGFQYIVPNVSSAQCLIKVQGLGGSTVFDVSDSVFTISPPVANSLTLLTPNGGEILTEGNTYFITWSSTGTIGLIDLYYSTDNGINWIFIDDNLQNTGQYAWTVPGVASSQCLVKIVSGALADQSDAVFIIQQPVVPGNNVLLAQYYFNEGSANDDVGSINGQRHDLELVTDRFGCPNHAFKFGPSDGYITLGDTLDEVFAAPDSSFAFSVWIKKNGSGSWGTIIAKNAGNYCSSNQREFSLSLENTGTIKFAFASTLIYQALVNMRTVGTISDLNWHHIAVNYDGSIYSSGLDRVEIYIDNQLQTLTAGNIYGSLGNIQNGPAQLAIGGEADDAGNPCGSLYFNGALDDIRMYAGNLSSSDVSGLYNETLTCPANTLTITSPNSSMSLNEGAIHNIAWNSTGQVANVDLYYSTDGGDYFTLISNNVSNTGTYAWTVPSVASTNCLIRIEETGSPTVLDESDAAFTIVQNTLMVDVPNGGQSWDGLSTHYIWWIKTGNIPSVDLYYTLDNGTNWTLIADNLTGTYYNWTVPNVGSTDCKIKVEQTGNTSVWDESDNTFTINYIAPELTLTSHNAGQTFIIGTTSYISWQSAGQVGDINIYFSSDSAATWSLVSGSESNDGSYAWSIPNIMSSNCLIKIEDATDPAVADSSDMVFSIEEAHSITITYPNGGELIETNSNDSIIWTWTGLFESVDIYYSANGGSSWYIIEELVANTGFFSWSPTFASANFLIKVVESANSSIYDISDQAFEVGPTAPIELLYPNGGEVFTGAFLDTIIWDANGNVDFNDIKFSSDGGATWVWAGDAPAELEAIQWAIPNINSTTCLLAYGSDTTDTYFTIVGNTDSITVLSPNGGEVYQGGDTLIVTWDNTGSSPSALVDFYYKLGYGFSLRATVPNTGSLEYVLPNVTTTTAEVRLQLHGTTIYDDSDAPFTVNEIEITVLYPNGGEVFTGNDSIQITWSQTGTFDGVELSYTPDAGSHYVLIEENVSGLSYWWTVPNISTTNCRIKVNRVGVTKDESNAVFTINNVPLPPWDSIATINVDDLQYHQWLSQNIGFYSGDQWPGGVFSNPFNTIKKTLDGGQTWTQTNPIPSSYQGLPLAIYGAWFFDVNNGIVIGHPMQWNSHQFDTWVTSDGGMTWTLRSDTIFADFSTYSDFGMVDFEMLNVNVGFANARTYNITLQTVQDVMFLTTDGGLTWNVRPTPELCFGYGGEFVNDSVGFVVGSNYVHKTTNGGLSWTNNYQVQGGGVGKDLDFVNESTGYVMTRLPNGSWFNIIRTTDQGLTWDVRNVPPISYLDVGDMFFLTENTGLISSTANPGVSGIWRTMNGGLTWETDSLVATVPVQKSDRASDIVMVTEAINYALLSGMIIKAGAITPIPQINTTWTYTNTGNSHTIYTPYTSSITIDGSPISLGDFVGVFYDSLGTPACAGFMEWTSQIQSVRVYGDDTLTTQPDGFAVGEAFQWKIWRASDGMVFDATATYIQPPAMPNTGYFEPDGMSGLLSLGAFSMEYQYINLPMGWSFFSTYMDPFEPNIDSLCTPFVSEVIIAKDGNGNTYWPQWGINTIGEVLIGEGYQIKMNSAQTMTVEGLGVVPENTPVTIVQGWSFLGYLRKAPAPINVMLSPVVSEVNLVKNGNGQIYWPQWGINAIGNMMPGEGYQIKMNSQQILTYPANSIMYSKVEMMQPQNRYFKKAINTGNNMSLGLLTHEMNYGTEIGVFNQSGLPVGCAVVDGNFTAITLWGDDETTLEIDGLVEGEEFTVRTYSNLSGLENNLTGLDWIEGNGRYEKNKISVGALVSGLPAGQAGFRLNQNVPNPFTFETEFSYYLPESTRIEFSIFNVIGEKVAILKDEVDQAGQHSIFFDAHDLPVGSYYYRLKSEKYAETKKMVLIR
ncbi:MAG: hypothetical protein K9H62_18005 [Bacteroidales bacterium]|nr:hypothetical protein [Bacteroidales bacterium]